MNFSKLFRLLEHNESLMPRLFSALQKTTNDLAGAHFSAMETLSFNLSPSHSDAVGIYVFPKKYIFDGNLKKNGGFANYPFIHIIQPSKNARILNLNMSAEECDSLLLQMGLPKEFLERPDIYHKSTTKMTEGHRFWGTLEAWRNAKQLSRNVSWNTLFAKTKYNTLYDPGLGIIHYNEPSQIVYMTPNAYEVVDVIRNSNTLLLVAFKKAFPDFKLVNRTKRKHYPTQIIDQEYSFQKDDDYFIIRFSGHSHGKIPDISVNGNRVVSSFDDVTVEHMISVVKAGLLHFKSNYLKRVDTGRTAEILTEVAKEFNFVYDGGDSISKNYRSKPTVPGVVDSIVNVIFTFYDAYEPLERPESLVMSLRKYGMSRKKTSNLSNPIDSYHYTETIPYDAKKPIRTQMSELIEKFEKSLEKRYQEEQSSYYSNYGYGVKEALRNLRFIRNRVLKLKTNAP